MVAAGQTGQTEGRCETVGLRQTRCRVVGVDVDRLKQAVAVVGGKSHLLFAVGFSLLAEPMVVLVLRPAPLTDQVG